MISNLNDSFHVGLSVTPSIDFVVCVFWFKVTSTRKSEERGSRCADIIEIEIEYFVGDSMTFCRNAIGFKTYPFVSTNIA